MFHRNSSRTAGNSYRIKFGRFDHAGRTTPGPDWMRWPAGPSSASQPGRPPGAPTHAVRAGVGAGQPTCHPVYRRKHPLCLFCPVHRGDMCLPAAVSPPFQSHFTGLLRGDPAKSCGECTGSVKSRRTHDRHPDGAGAGRWRRRWRRPRVAAALAAAAGQRPRWRRAAGGGRVGAAAGRGQWRSGKLIVAAVVVAAGAARARGGRAGKETGASRRCRGQPG